MIQLGKSKTCHFLRDKSCLPRQEQNIFHVKRQREKVALVECDELSNITITDATTPRKMFLNLSKKLLSKIDFKEQKILE